MDFKTVIEDKGLLKSYVAKKIGISNVRLSQYINNRRPMPNDVKERLTWFLMEV
jgi:predicted transcriptional regulator